MPSLKDEYEKLYIIGKGSYATIWKARHKELGYVRALKMSNEQVENENDPAYKSFLNECKMLLQLGNGSHPNIVHIYKPSLIDNRAVVEMDYVDGETLDQYLQRERFLPISEVYKFINDIVGALAYCHHDIYRYLMNPNVDDLKTDPNDGHNFIIDQATEQRLVAKYAVTHNDLHSRNIMRRHYDGNYMLLDFGLAIQDGKAVKSSSRRGGALEYMSPEKFSDSCTITTQSDVYSLGILLYEVLAGRVPFVLDQKAFDSNPTEASYIIMKAHKEAIPPDISILRREAFEKVFPGQTYVKDYPDELESIILRCLEKNPANRYPNAKVLYEDIKKITADNRGQKLQEQLKQANDTIAKLEEKLAQRQNDTELIACPECGGKLSRNTLACPHCGHLMKAQLTTATSNIQKSLATGQQSTATLQLVPSWCVWLLLIVSVIAAIIATINHNSNVTQESSKVVEEVAPVEKAAPENEVVEGYYVDLGLPSGTRWKSTNENGFYTYDEAISKFGNKLPTKKQLKELKDECTWTWNTAKKGYDVRGRNGNSTFLPAAGYRYRNGFVSHAGSDGIYWSSTPIDSEYAWRLGFTSADVYMNCIICSLGQSVRLVK